MKNDLVLAKREIVELAGLRKTIRLEIMPYGITQVTLIKIDMKNANLCTRLVLNTEIFLLYTLNLEAVKNSLRQHIANQSGVVKLCRWLCHNAKVQLI